MRQQIILVGFEVAALRGEGKDRGNEGEKEGKK